MIDGRQEQHEVTPRRRRILRRVVEEYIETGRPVGSRTLAAGGFDYAPSTIRYELAWLEAEGLLDHPHTSAGRVPTDRGYRFYVSELIRERPRAERLEIDVAGAHRELDTVLRATADALAHATGLLALVTAPPLATTEIRHVEVLLLQADVVMIVVITAAGEVAKRSFAFDRSVDPGLAEWAKEYLNEQLGDVALGSRQIRRRLAPDDVGPMEREFLRAVSPVFSEVLIEAGDRIYLGGASRLMTTLRSRDVEEFARVAEMIEERGAGIASYDDMLGPGRLHVRIGEEHGDPALRPLAVVSAGYGVGARTLGSVSLIGPTRMDYARALAVVRGAAASLGEFAEELFT